MPSGLVWSFQPSFSRVGCCLFPCFLFFTYSNTPHSYLLPSWCPFVFSTYFPPAFYHQFFRKQFTFCGCFISLLLANSLYSCFFLHWFTIILLHAIHGVSKFLNLSFLCLFPHDHKVAQNSFDKYFLLWLLNLWLQCSVPSPNIAAHFFLHLSIFSISILIAPYGSSPCG